MKWRRPTSRFFAAFTDLFKKPQVHTLCLLYNSLTIYAFTATDSGPNSFPVSLKPEFADICGFTSSKFEEFFRDMMSETLHSILEKSRWSPAQWDTVTHRNLKKKTWTGTMATIRLEPEKVLNLYSIANFFINRDFTSYWPESGTISLLRSVFRKKTESFIDFNIKKFSRRPQKN
jgi:hypothetical protein